jgi:hypothetical protein
LIDATLADLGVGSSWQSIHRMRPRVPLACAACGGSMHAKVSPRELRFFAHDAARQECPLNGETPDHRLLKSAIAAAVRAAGWHAALEAEGPDRRWRADVLATSPDGGRRVAWEAQLAQQHEDDTRARTLRYSDDGVEVVWVFDRPVSGGVPAVTVEVDQASIRVAGPVARLVVGRCEQDRCVLYGDVVSRPPCPGHGRWKATTLTLDMFVSLVCQDNIVRTALSAVGSLGTGKPEDRGPARSVVGQWWTSPVYLRRAAAIRQAQQDADASVADVRARLRLQQETQGRRRRAESERREREKQQRVANLAALLERQRRLEPVVMRHVAAQTGTKPWAFSGDPEHAAGVSIIADGRVLAVICPVASRITAEIAARLADVIVYVATERERQVVTRRCGQGQRCIVVSDPLL